MRPSCTFVRASLVAGLVFATLAGASPARAATATLIDSFTDPLPAHGSLPATGARILFLGSRCDAPACPPGPTVTIPYYDVREQSGVTGIVGTVRRTSLATYFEPNPGASGVLILDPADGGRLALHAPSGPPLSAVLKYGDGDHLLNLDLLADGSDCLEIEILESPATVNNPLGVLVNLGQGNEGALGGLWANHGRWLTGPGLVVIPYAQLNGRFADFAHDVDYLRFEFIVPPSAASDLVVGEIRTASTSTPVAPASWGRIKDAYRR